MGSLEPEPHWTLFSTVPRSPYNWWDDLKNVSKQQTVGVESAEVSNFFTAVFFYNTGTTLALKVSCLKNVDERDSLTRCFYSLFLLSE